MHTSYYDLDSFAGETGRHTSRTLPILQYRQRHDLERRTRLFSNKYIQTLEPRLFYNYIPTKSQNDLPNFDSSENSFSYDQLP